MNKVDEIGLFLLKQEKNKDKAQALAYSIKLQKYFGLVLRESLAIKKTTIKDGLKNGILTLSRKDMTPNAKVRKIAITSKKQEEVLREVLSFMNRKRYYSLIPPSNKLIEQYNYAERIRKKIKKECDIRFNYSDFYNSFKIKQIIGDDKIVKLYMPAWKIKYPKDYIWYKDEWFAVRKSFNRPKKKVEDLKNTLKRIAMPVYMEDALWLVSDNDNRNEILEFFKQIPVTVKPLNLDKMLNRKGFEYIVYNRAIELTMHSIYWIADKDGNYYNSPYNFIRFTNYDLPKGKEHLETKGFLGYHEEPEEGNIGTIISQIGKDNVAGILKMTNINVEGGRIINIPFKHDVNESFDDFSFLSITAYV